MSTTASPVRSPLDSGVLHAADTVVRAMPDGTPVSIPVDDRMVEVPARDLRVGDFVWHGCAFWAVTRVGNVTKTNRVRVADTCLKGGSLRDADALVRCVRREAVAA
jgi:hypothetical protein